MRSTVPTFERWTRPDGVAPTSERWAYIVVLSGVVTLVVLGVVATVPTVVGAGSGASPRVDVAGVTGGASPHADVPEVGYWRSPYVEWDDDGEYPRAGVASGEGYPYVEWPSGEGNSDAERLRAGGGDPYVELSPGPSVTRDAGDDRFVAVDGGVTIPDRAVERWGSGEGDRAVDRRGGGAAMAGGRGDVVGVLDGRELEPVADVTVGGFDFDAPAPSTAVDTGEDDVAAVRPDRGTGVVGERRAVSDPGTGPVGGSAEGEVRDRGTDLGKTAPVDPPSPASEFGLGFVVGGIIVALVSLRGRHLLPSLGGATTTAGSDGAQGGPGEDSTATPTTTGDGDGEETGDGAAGRPASDGTRPPSSGSNRDFVPDDRLVERMLGRHQGRLKQAAIVESTEWSKSKVSRLLTRMQEEGRIIKVSVGRENVIYLKGEEPPILSDATPSPG